MKNLTLARIRLANLKALIGTECQGDREEAAKRINTGIVNLKRYLSGTRDLGDKFIKKIESSFNLKTGYMDIEHKASKPVYFLTVKVKGDLIYQFIQATRGVEEIVECSAVLGDFDVILKIEVEDFKFLSIASGKISKMPGVIRTRTYHAIPTLRWQKQQESGEYIYRQEDVFSNYLDAYVYKNIISCLEKAAQWESGEICIPIEGKKKHSARLAKIYTSVKHTMYVVRKHSSIKEIDKKLLSIEAEKIKEDKITSKRIVVIRKSDENYFLDNREKLQELEEKFSSIGCFIRFILAKDCTSTDLSETDEQYLVIDREYVMVYRSQQKRIYFKKEPQYINMYLDSFNQTWGKSLSFNEIEKKICKPL